MPLGCRVYPSKHNWNLIPLNPNSTSKLMWIWWFKYQYRFVFVQSLKVLSNTAVPQNAAIILCETEMSVVTLLLLSRNAWTQQEPTAAAVCEMELCLVVGSVFYYVEIKYAWSYLYTMNSVILRFILQVKLKVMKFWAISCRHQSHDWSIAFPQLMYRIYISTKNLRCRGCKMQNGKCLQ